LLPFLPPFIAATPQAAVCRVAPLFSLPPPLRRAVPLIFTPPLFAAGLRFDVRQLLRRAASFIFIFDTPPCYVSLICQLRLLLSAGCHDDFDAAAVSSAGRRSFRLSSVSCLHFHADADAVRRCSLCR